MSAYAPVPRIWSPPRTVTITVYTPWAWMRRHGFVTEGEIDYREVTPGPPTMLAVQEAVCAHFRQPLRIMTSCRRAREEARLRQVSMYLCRELTPRSLPEIGRFHGGRDHTTVIHAIRQTEKLRAEDPELDADIRAIARGLVR
ncbi:MAG TPA: helix-turn-helix domain-containing protein [Sphingomicrobium sp.]|nr:helix-turn-helix domain-containing protein [Sphingomicrobium sp.]